MKSIGFGSASATLFGCASPFTNKNKSGKRPNIIAILTDDTHWEYLGSYNGPYLTPNLDRLAAEGMRFTRAYISASVCTPSRYSFLTGKYAGRCKAPSFLDNNPASEMYTINWNTEIHRSEDHLAGYMKEAGYETAYVGKFHTGRNAKELGCHPIPEDGDPYSPEFDRIRKENQKMQIKEMNRLGWDYAASIVYGNVDGNKNKKTHYHNIDWLTHGALNFLDKQENAEKPFFLYFCPTVVHGPHIVDSIKKESTFTFGGILEEAPKGHPPRETIFQRLEQAGLDVTHRSAGMLWLDDAVGAILKKLEQLGIQDDTTIMYHADHSTLGKGTCYEQGVRIPMIVKAPGITKPASLCQEFVQNIDFVPTVLELAGVEPSQMPACDGTSFVPLLKGSDTILHDDLYFEFGTTRGVSTKKWKYISFRYTKEDLAKMKSGKAENAPDYNHGHWLQLGMKYYPAFWDADQLFDLEYDPEEQYNLAGDPAYAEILKEMRDRLKTYLETFDHPYPMEADAFQKSETYRKLTEKTQAIGPEEYEWYRIRAW
jgi:arylsulfatase A-like enzyme